ncbi:DUF3152 domain-containing protein [Streptomyces sp. NPDC048172]|uniref:DUF3152 domain-containing protein n=1 Tax=Streptomyces sp. NPDC048172 TaxID=3365505 RepID=UPI00370FD313
MKRGTVGLLVLLMVILIGGGAVAWDKRNEARAPAGAEDEPRAEQPPTPTPEPSLSDQDKPSAAPSPSDSPSDSPPESPSNSPSDKPSEPASADPQRIPIPATGPGTFATARSTGATAGQGATLRRYKVLVEDGIELSAKKAAAEVQAVLANARGWTADGRNSFRLVDSGPVDFVVRIATPGTVDQICGRAGLRTRGEVNCSVGSDVVVNLKRWVLGSDQFDGPIGEYRALIVNHEVGHRLGHGHVGCAGPGQRAPAMMQQIDGLNGCKANAWPYDEKGRYISGPTVP